MKRVLTIAILLAGFCAIGTAQQAGRPRRVVTPKPGIKVSKERSVQLKQIADRQKELADEFSKLEIQKVLIAQRCALELHLTAEQVDAMDLILGAEGYEFRAKPAAQAEKPKPTPGGQ